MVRIENRVVVLNSVDGISNSRTHDFTIKFNLPSDVGDGRICNHFVGVDKVSTSYSYQL